LKKLGNLKEAELSYRKAIKIKPDLAEAHLNLGIILTDLGKSEEAEIFVKKAIELDPTRTSYFYYGNCFFWRKEFEAARKYLYKANILSSKDSLGDPILNAAESKVALAIKTSVDESKLDYSENSKIHTNRRLKKLILNRSVEVELIPYLYTLKNRKLEFTKDGRFGEGMCSIDFEFFNDPSPIIKNLVNDISNICKEALKLNKIFFVDSFFNIFVSGSGAVAHAHRSKEDKCFDLHIHKYSLVYYLDTGDQSGEDPGILNLYEPDEKILPTNGMIVIIDSKRFHSVSYHGNKDRIMIGVNFYGL